MQEATDVQRLRSIREVDGDGVLNEVAIVPGEAFEVDDLKALRKNEKKRSRAQATCSR